MNDVACIRDFVWMNDAALSYVSFHGKLILRFIYIPHQIPPFKHIDIT